MPSVVDSTVSLDAEAQRYGREIAAAWQKSVEGILEVGSLLTRAKAELDHGEFERMVRKVCPFGASTARRLMSVSNNQILSNRAHVRVLPSSWGTLAELAKYEPKELSHAINNEWVKPDMTREDVGTLHRRVKKALGQRVREPRDGVQVRPQSFAVHLRAAMDQDLIGWLSSVEATTADVIAERVAGFLCTLREEMTDG